VRAPVLGLCFFVSVSQRSGKLEQGWGKLIVILRESRGERVRCSVREAHT